MTLRATEAQSGAATRPGPRSIVGRIGDRIAMLAWWWHVAVVALIAAVVMSAAYQTHPAYDIAVGNRVQDDPIVTDFNAAEQQPTAVGGRAYRWTRDESTIAFPGIGRTATNVTITLAGGANPNPDVVILVNNGEIARFHLAPDFADYPLTIPAPYLTTGNVTLTIHTTPFHAPGDRRDLGVLVSRVQVRPADGLALPPARTALALCGTVLLLMLALLVAGLRGWEAAGAALLVIAGFAALLIQNRLFITEGAGPWLRVSVGTLALATALRFALPPIMRWLDIAGDLFAARGMLTATVGIFAVRLGGLYHPAMIVSDLIFHVHRFEDLIVRHIWYQEVPALYDQGRPVPYPPGAYLLFAPFAPFVRNRADLLAIGTQVLDATRILIVGLVVWKVTRDRIAAACATLLAGIVPIAFMLFSWGNLTNAVGEWALTLLFAFCVLGGERIRWWSAVAFIAVVLLALLSHIGVAVTTVALLGAGFAVWLIVLLRERRAPWREQSFLTALGLTCIAGVLAFALFYRIPLAGAHTTTNDPALTTSPATQTGGYYEIGGPRPDPSIGLRSSRTNNPIVAVIGQIWVEGYAFYRLWPLLLALLGFWALWQERPNPSAPFPKRKGEQGAERLVANEEENDVVESPPLLLGRGLGGRSSRRLCLVCLIWIGVSLAFLLIGVLAGRYVRYAVTAIPAVATGAGVALGYGWRWQWGRGFATILLGVSIVTTLLVWYGRITRAYHT